MDISNILKNVVDMHVHSNPDFSNNMGRIKTDEQRIEECRDAGMLGLVLKTHGWPVPQYAKLLDSKYDDFHVIPSVSLNLTAGGPKPWVMEMAHHMGAKFVWLPTWSSATEYRNPSGWVESCCKDIMPKLLDIRKEEYYTLLDENGNLTEDAKECIKLAAEYGMVMGTGHISTKESLAVMRFAHEIGYKKMTWTHPLQELDVVTDDDLKEFARLGGNIELTAISILPSAFATTTTARFKEVAEMVGPDHCFFGTDHCFDWNPPIPVTMAMLIELFIVMGMPVEDVTEVASTARRLLEI